MLAATRAPAAMYRDRLIGCSSRQPHIDMQLRDIEYFAVVAEHAHLGRAADALGLSQPALSKSLRRLEEALQAKLVRRTPKGVELTPEGSVLFLRVRELRLSLQGVAREVAEVGEGRVGYLRIGVGFPMSEEL